LRSVTRVGSALSLFGMSRFGSSLAVLDFVHIGSSLSLRSFGRLGATLAVLDFAHLGSSLSVRGFARFGSDISGMNKLIFTNSGNYIREQLTQPSPTPAHGSFPAGLGFYVNNNEAMRIFSTTPTPGPGGTLHGTWFSPSPISFSDRRLKENITPLVQTLSQNLGKKRSASIKPATKASGAGKPSVSSWLLRQLRPVSYNFRQGNEAKYMRFGFIADEIEQILPEVVRDIPRQAFSESASEEEKTGKKGIVYTDLIAVLTTIVKDLNMNLHGLQGRMKTAEDELDRLDEEDPMDDDTKSMF